MVKETIGSFRFDHFFSLEFSVLFCSADVLWDFHYYHCYFVVVCITFSSWSAHLVKYHASSLYVAFPCVVSIHCTLIVCTSCFLQVFSEIDTFNILEPSRPETWWTRNRRHARSASWRGTQLMDAYQAIKVSISDSTD